MSMMNVYTFLTTTVYNFTKPRCFISVDVQKSSNNSILSDYSDHVCSDCAGISSSVFLSLLKCLLSLLVQEIGFLFSSSCFLTSCMISPSVFFSHSEFFFPSCFWLSTEIRSRSIFLPASQCRILSICLVVRLLRAHLRAVSCNSVVTLPVISNSLCTALSISTPSPGNSVTYNNIVAIDNPVRFVTVSMVFHKAMPVWAVFFKWFFFLLCLFSPLPPLLT